MEKLLTLIKSILLSLFYYIINSFSKNKIVFNERSDYIISLTTYNKRINYVFLTIESLANQKFKPSKIILWLSCKDLPNGKLPSSLERLKKRGLEINIVSNNIRSYKKLTHFCEKKDKYKFNYVVTADDDVYYPRYWLQKINEKIIECPGYIYCYRGKSIKFNNDDISDYKEWSSDIKICDSNSALFMPTGVSGVCYPKESLSERMIDINGFLENCMYADDIWFKCSTLISGFGAKLVLDKNIHFTPVIFSLKKGLEVNNVQNGLNIVQFKKTMLYLNLSKKDFYKFH